MQANIEYPERRFEVERDSLEEELLDLDPNVIPDKNTAFKIYKAERLYH